MKYAAYILLLLCACDHYDRRLEIINNSNSEVAVEIYSDTLPDFPSVTKTEFYLSHGVLPEDTSKLTKMGKNGWPFAIARSSNKKLNLVIYNIDSLRKYRSIDTLIRRNIYKRHEFSEHELEKDGWRIILH